MKSALFCEHANESPLYEREGNRLVCRCPDDCYCKHDGGCKDLRRTDGVGTRELVVDGRTVASCTSPESLDAAKRLLSL